MTTIELNCSEEEFIQRIEGFKADVALVASRSGSTQESATINLLITRLINLEAALYKVK